MNLNRFFLILLIAFSFAACDEDDALSFELRHDGANVTAPQLGPGIHEYAVQFTDSDVDDYIGNRLVEIDFFAGFNPQKCELIVYQGAGNRPGIELYKADVTNIINAPQWYEHKLATPIEITGEEIWISLKVTHTETQQSVGCDAGPAQDGGDWLFHFEEGEWLSFRAYAGDSINWNIRGKIE